MNYSPELKDALLRRMLPPNNESITKISREEGISEQTLRNWRDKARKEGYAAPGMDAVYQTTGHSVSGPEQFSLQPSASQGK